MPDEYLTSSLAPFGWVIGVQHLTVRGFPNIRTGTRMVSMSILKPIPPELTIANFKCSIKYHGQPKFCFGCCFRLALRLGGLWLMLSPPRGFLSHLRSLFSLLQCLPLVLQAVLLMLGNQYREIMFRPLLPPLALLWPWTFCFFYSSAFAGLCSIQEELRAIHLHEARATQVRGGQRKVKLLRPFFLALRKSIGLNNWYPAFAILILVFSTMTRLKSWALGGGITQSSSQLRCVMWQRRTLSSHG